MSRRQRGVTLIELMIVVVIVGILAGIAIPAYRQYVIRANRADAKNALLSTAQNLERCYTNSTPYAYNSATCNAAVVLPSTLATGTYRIERVAVPLPAVNYTIRAVPLGAQANDALCRNFVLDQAGVQTVTGTAAATPQECWRR